MSLVLFVFGNVEKGFCVEGSFVVGQLENGVCYFFGLFILFYGDGFFDLVDLVWFVVVGMYFGMDVVGLYVVDVDVFMCDFFGQVGGEGFQCVFGGGVVDIFVGIVQVG